MINKLYNKFLILYAKLLGRPWLHKWNELLINLGLRGIGIDNYQDDQMTGERYVMNKYIKNRNKPVILDIGAHIGDSAILVKSINPSAKIYSFEPNPSTYIILRKNSLKYHFNSYNLAIGDRVGSSIIYDTLGGSSPFSSLYKSVIESQHHSKTHKYQIKMTTLDKFYKENLIGKKIDLLKVDVEGHEYKVLLGAKKLISRGLITMIQFEFNVMNMHSNVFFIDFQNLLKDYTLYRLLPHGILPINSDSILHSEIFMFQNILAIRKK